MRIAASSLTRVRRSTTVLAVAAAGALVLSGCSDSGLSSGVAAVVDGKEITVAQVQEATKEFNTLPVSPTTPTDVLTLLVYGDLAEQAHREAGNPPITDAQLVNDLRGGGLQNPSESVIDLYRSINYLQSAQQLPPTEGLTIEVNPRYGEWDAENGQVVAQTPEWITQVTGAEAQN
ncbi:hypothetical protein [Ornithinimicrobium cavernae]|uniref:hypothetical protein n=1 Tax=Ornithinimicrobium cavernae TaxID=2666047 RepID=UPI000D69DC12|nr:hypothetical protein [Ornithinimicrobium cavernae]